jgi:hypothetical protein
MKTRVLSCLAACLCTVAGFAQELPYTFSVTQQAYLTFSDGTSLNQGMVWDDPDWEVPIGFDFQYMNQTFSNMYFGGIDGYGGELIFGDINGATFQGIMPYFQDLVDGGYFEDAASDSPISYKLTGSPGSRVLWVQWSNVAFYNDEPPHPMRMNFQIRLFEGTNNIEFHYGPNQNLDNGVIQDYTGIVIGMAKNIDFNEFTAENVWAFTGDPQAPTAVTYTSVDDFMGGVHLNDTPAPNTVYRFSTGPASVSDQSMESAKVYPTVLMNNLNVVLPGNEKAMMRITDNTGRIVVEQQIQPGYQSIDSSIWSAGHYIVSIMHGEQLQTVRVVKY